MQLFTPVYLRCRPSAFKEALFLFGEPHTVAMACSEALTALVPCMKPRDVYSSQNSGGMKVEHLSQMSTNGRKLIVKPNSGTNSPLNHHNGNKPGIPTLVSCSSWGEKSHVAPFSPATTQKVFNGSLIAKRLKLKKSLTNLTLPE